MSNDNVIKFPKSKTAKTVDQMDVEARLAGSAAALAEMVDDIRAGRTKSQVMDALTR